MIDVLSSTSVAISIQIQHFEADFPQKVSLKILNSGIILKSFTHEVMNMYSQTKWKTVSNLISCFFVCLI